VAVTVREVLALEPIRSAGARVLAGRDNLDRPVRWVHVAELPDIAHLLEGGELLLTTGLGLAGDAGARRRYVDDLARAGAAGLVVELGRTFEALPGDLVGAAEGRGLPLVSLAHETRFVEVTEVVHREILSRQYELRDRAARVSRDLAEQILDGADVTTLVGHLGAVFGTDVLFEDAARRVVAMSRHDATDGATPPWEAHATLDHRVARDGPAGSGVVHRAGGSAAAPGCAWMDIWIRHDRWGRLHVLDPGRDGDVDELLIDRAGAALALAMLAEKDAAHLAERAGDALIGEIVAGRHGSGAAVLRRARGLGADLSAGRLVVAALEIRSAADAADPSDDDRLEALRALAVACRAAVTEHGCRALVGASGDRVIAIVAVPGTRPLAVVLDEIVKTASARALRRSRFEVIAGASDLAVAGALHRAVEEATVAATFARDAGPGRRVHHFADLGTYQLLLRLAEGPELARFVDSELRPLLERDDGTPPRLVPTLRAYLKHAGRKADVARELGIQRRTLYQRMARVERLLGRDVDDQSTRSRLTLAFQGLDFLAGRAGTPGSRRVAGGQP
jgi:PucR family transcriptional regulator, purine catabolism regulatory protein